MISLCQQVKFCYDRLQTLTDRYILEYEKVKNVLPAQAGVDRAALRRLKRELETAYQELETKMFISIKEARELLGDKMVLGPEEIATAFGFEIEESEIPPIPYSREELEKAKELGEQLILRVSHDNEGNPMTMKRINEIMETRMDPKTEGKFLYDTGSYKDEEFYKNDPLKTEWRLVGSSFVPDVSSPMNIEGNYTKDTTNNNYIHQTRLLREYIKSIGGDILTEEEEEECSDENLKKLSEQMGVDWRSQEITNKGKYEKNWPEVGRQLAKLQINQNHRRSATEIIYDRVLSLKNLGEPSILENNYERSNALSSFGFIVTIGCFNYFSGVKCHDKTDFRYILAGVILSR